MKKYLLVFLVVVLLIALILGIRSFNKRTVTNNIENVTNNMENVTNNMGKDTKNIAKTINSNSKLPVEYLSKYDRSMESNKKYDFINNYMSNDFKNNDIEFSYYGYPNDESDYCLGRITLLTNKYNILGVTVGDNLIKSLEKIKKHGFKLEKSNNYMIVTLQYNDFSIRIESDYKGTDNDDNNLIIQQIKLEAESEYLGNVLY